MVFKTSLCNVICHSVFITMPTGRTLLFPLIGKLKKKKMTEKKPHLFTSSSIVVGSRKCFGFIT